MDTQAGTMGAQVRPVSGYRNRYLERRHTLLFYIGMACVSTIALLQNMGQTFVLPNYDRPVLALGLVCVFFLLNDKDVLQKLRKKAYMNIFAFWALFCALAAYSSYVTKDIVPVYNPVTANILFQAFLFEGLCLMVYAVVTDRVIDVVNFLFAYIGILVLFTDLMMFGGIRYYSGVFETYLVGSKFDVTYLHMNFVAFFCVRLKLARSKKQEAPLPGMLLATMAAIILLIGVRVDCNTGMLGALFQIILVYACDRWPKTVARRLGSPRTFLITLLISVLFAYYVTWLLNLPPIKHLIVDTLHRSLTLTGRTDIYTAYPIVMRNNWSWGFGFGNNYPVSWKNFGYTDTQNALLEWILQIGLVGTIALVLMLYVIMVFYRNKASMTSAAPLLTLLYVYLLLGTVEITMNYNFLLFMMVLFMLSCADQKVETETEFKLQYAPRQTRRRKRLME